MRIELSDLELLVTEVFLNHGLALREAEIVSRSIIDAEAKGVHHHGLVMVDFYLRQIGDKKGEPLVEVDIGSFCLVDGGDVLGPVAADYAVELSIQRAKKNGVGFVGVHNKSPFLMAETHSHKIATTGCVGVVMCNSRARVAPPGSYEPVFGPNPISFGFPRDEYPLLVDFATSSITMGQIRSCLAANETLPEGVAVNEKGLPTVDPKLALDGAVVPFGGHKGYGLALAIELLAGPLVGAKAGKSVPGTRGFLIGAFSLHNQTALEKFKNNVMALVREIKNARRNPGVNEILVPGEDRLQKLKLASVEGLQISDESYQKLLNLAGKAP
ncbi:MAG: Ldh family oxidoreductase [Thermodesulfobacteriota bacterium]|nr:Ldh family oxidoreductase [Thermodesulfobacteriota bacterium]